MIYDGKLDNAMSLLKWLTDLENLKIDGRIEEVMMWESMQGGIQLKGERGNERREQKDK